MSVSGGMAERQNASTGAKSIELDDEGSLNLNSSVVDLLGKQAAFGAFTRAFAKQNNLFEQAIQSLDSLNDQIVQFIFSPAASLASISGVGGHSSEGVCPRLEDALVPIATTSLEEDDRQSSATPRDSDVIEKGRTPQPSTHDTLLTASNSASFLPSNREEQRESLSSSMALMRRLLVDAQAKFRRMMEENKALASRIDGDIQTAHQEVSLLRAELADTNKRITQITNCVSVTDVSSPTSSTPINREEPIGMKVVELSSEPVYRGFDRDNCTLSNGKGGSRSPDRTKATNVVEPLVKKPPLKSTSLRRHGGGVVATGKKNRSCANTNSPRSSGDKMVTSRNGECVDSVIGTVDLMTGKSQDADDEDGDCDRCRVCPHRDTANVILPLEEKLNNLEEQNEHLNERIGSLQKELDIMHRVTQTEQANGDKDNYPSELDTALATPETSSVDIPTAVASSSSSSSVTLKNPEVERLEIELKHAKDALAALKADRKRLKAEKFDLLNQMKQLYGTLEDKEKELRDFIRNYEQRMRESDDNLKQLVREREDSEREKWNILKHARDEAERSVALCAQLGIKEAQVKQLQEELICIREKLGYISDTDVRSRSNGYRSPSATSTHTHGRDSSDTPTPTLGGSEPTSSYDGTPTITVDRDSGCSPGHHSARGHHHHHHRDKDARRPSLTGLSRSAEEIYNSSGSSDTGATASATKKRRDKNSTWGSISRVFSRSRQRKSLDPGFYEGTASGSEQQRSSWSPQSSLCASPLTEDSYAEKLKLLEEARGQRMDRWKAATVLAWLEITLGMPQYGAMCAENIKSGKILLELSDPELEAGLGIANSMHRRKLRLAIEEHRDPPSNPYPKISHLTHAWVVEEWLPSLGLMIYADNFVRQLIDGRVLETLSKKDLEKSLGVTRKFHQVSLTHAVQLLRMVKFDKQLLQQRRSHSESMDVDPLVWTNQRFIKWAKSIDLSEYADNLRDSGVHGALVVLEPSFQADTMATALGIPASKNIIRRHLTTELENLVQPARMSLEAEALVNSKRGKSTSSLHSSSSGSLGRNFLRSSSSKGTLDRPDNKRRSSMRGSLTRALGLKLEAELSSHHHPIDDSSNEQQPRHNSTPELTKKTLITTDDLTLVRSRTSASAALLNYGPQRRSLSASRVKLGQSSTGSSKPASNSGGYLETMTVTPV